MTDFSIFSGTRRWVKLDKTQVLPESITTVFTDGACKANPNGPAGWGWWRSDESWSAGGFDVASNNIAELTAIFEVLKAAPDDLDLAVVSDSEYAVMATTVWATGWSRREWRKADGQPVENLALIRATHRKLCERSGLTYFKRVRGHGRDASMLPEHVVGNEHADRLACEAKERAIAGDVVLRFGPGWGESADETVVLNVEPLISSCTRCGGPGAEAVVELTRPARPVRRLDLCPGCVSDLGAFVGWGVGKVAAS